MKNKIFLLISICLFQVTLTAKDDDTPVMQYWRGGKMDLNFNALLNTNIGTSSGLLSGIMSNAVESISLNPAVMPMQKTAFFFFEVKPGFGTNTLGLSSSDIISPEDIAENSDDFLKDTATFIFPSTNFRKDTEVGNLNMKASGGVTSVAVAFPIMRNLVFGASYNPVIDIAADLFVNSISTNLKTTKEVGNTQTAIDMILHPTVGLNTSLKMNKTSFALGYNFMPGDKGVLSAGITFNRYQVRNYIDLNINIDGMIVLNNGPEYYFNDPADQNIDAAKGESNKLFMKARGDFKSTKWGFTIGAFFDPSGIVDGLSFMNISMALDIVPEFSLEDKDAKLESLQPKFLTGKFNGKDEEELDIIIDSLDLAKPNLTKQTKNVFTDKVLLSLPSSFTLGFDFKLGEHTLVLNYVNYFNEFSYKFDKYKLGKTPTAGIRFGADFRMPDELSGWNWAYLPIRLLYLDFDGLIFQALGRYSHYKDSHYRVAGGVMLGDAIVEGFSDDDKDSMKDALGIPIPTSFTLSRKYTVFDKMNIGVAVMGFPDILMKFSFGYAL